MNTYREAYIAALEQRLLQGGQLAEVDATVAEYNAFDRIAFDKWLNGARLACLTCGSVVTAGGLASKDPDASVICDGCRQ